jgi:hypothetical protein
VKKSEIKLGGMFTNGKGTIREIVGVGPYLLYDGQMDTDCVRYKLIAKKLGPHSIGSEQNCTRQSFASWAKKLVSEAS